MSWQPIVSRRRFDNVPAVVAIYRSGGSVRLVVDLAPEAMPTGWQRGTKLSASIGVGEDWGRLRLAADGFTHFKLCRPTTQSRRLRLNLPLPAGVEPKSGQKAAVECKLAENGKALILVLPPWAAPRTSADSGMRKGRP